MTPEIHAGLENIHVDTTEICDIDGAQGTLHYRGHDIKALAEQSWLHALGILLLKRAPSAAERQALDDLLCAGLRLPPSLESTIRAFPETGAPMAVLQSIVPLVQAAPSHEVTLEGLSPALCEGLFIAAQMAGALAMFHRHHVRADAAPPPRTEASFLSRFLHHFHGVPPTAAAARTFEVAHILQMEHGFNASTFTARVTASTRARTAACISAAIGALSGALHGGADQAALEMALAVGDPEHADAYVEACLLQKTRIMGMGHRVYRTVDPRALILKPMAQHLCENSPFERCFQTLAQLEASFIARTQTRARPLRANVEFYKGPVFYALGFSPRYFTALFALARVFGWIAHIEEARATPKLVRPKAWYTGPKPKGRGSADRDRKPETGLRHR